MRNMMYDKTRNITTQTRLAAMLAAIALVAAGFAAGAPSAALADGGQGVTTESAAGEAGTGGTRSTGGEEAAGEGSDGKPRPAGFSPRGRCDPRRRRGHNGRGNQVGRQEGHEDMRLRLREGEAVAGEEARRRRRAADET